MRMTSDFEVCEPWPRHGSQHATRKPRFARSKADFRYCRFLPWGCGLGGGAAQRRLGFFVTIDRNDASHPHPIPETATALPTIDAASYLPGRVHHVVGYVKLNGNPSRAGASTALGPQRRIARSQVATVDKASSAAKRHGCGQLGGR
jgi:hypothetical protein